MNLGKTLKLYVMPGWLAIQLLAGTSQALASDLLGGNLKVPIPQRSISTPSQKLNRDGVAELKHGHQKKAKKLFYRAYLLDPEDPFTLNNLGYVAELEGDADRALGFYALAARTHTDAIIDRSSESSLRGKPLEAAFRQVQDSDREIGHVNEQAIEMLEKGRVFEAGNLLRSALEKHPRDPFLLNNLGYAMESVGDVEGAMRYYSAAASVHSTQRVVVTPRAKWRGRPISDVAAENAGAMNKQIASGEGVEAAVARLNLRGVAALNDNHPSEAREFFLQAYRQDAENAFTLNNLGYISELAGDRESAEMYYQAARSGREANARVSYATRPDAEGRKIDKLANANQTDVESTLKAAQDAKRRAHKTIELKYREPLSASNEKDATPVPAIGVEAPVLPALAPPDSQQDRNTPRPGNSSPPE